MWEGYHAELHEVLHLDLFIHNDNASSNPWKERAPKTEIEGISACLLHRPQLHISIVSRFSNGERSALGAISLQFGLKFRLYVPVWAYEFETKIRTARTMIPRLTPSSSLIIRTTSKGTARIRLRTLN